MERVGALIKKLQEQFQQNASADAISITAQMLLAEIKPHQCDNHSENKKVSVIHPSYKINLNNSPEITDLKKDNLEISTPLFQKDTSASKEKERSNWMFDEVHEAPTLTQHKKISEINDAVNRDSESINDKLKTEKQELGATLTEGPIRDLKKAIGINDRYLFIDELFRGDVVMYDRSIKTINTFTIFPEAQYWIQRELKLKLGWNENSETVKLFDQLIKRRFF